jgi:hypothetical protein
LFDLLGIFQQILNIQMDILRKYFDGYKYEQIIDSVNKLYDEFQNLPDITANPELKNILFDPQQGWTIVSLNPIMLDLDALKKALFFIAQSLKKIIRDNLGDMLSLSAYSKDLIPYLISNWDLLEILKINKSLVQNFLE